MGTVRKIGIFEDGSHDVSLASPEHRSNISTFFCSCGATSTRPCKDGILTAIKLGLDTPLESDLTYRVPLVKNERAARWQLGMSNATHVVMDFRFVPFREPMAETYVRLPKFINDGEEADRVGISDARTDGTQSVRGMYLSMLLSKYHDVPDCNSSYHSNARFAHGASRRLDPTNPDVFLDILFLFHTRTCATCAIDSGVPMF